MIIYRENTKNFTKKKLLQLINKFSKVAGYKINIQKKNFVAELANSPRHPGVPVLCGSQRVALGGAAWLP